jgi:CRISPR-associated protein Cmr1
VKDGMPVETFPLMNITPMFLNGSDSKRSPEPRAASVRGQLRYWLRAVEGGQGRSLDEVWKRESHFLGSTAGGSQVSVRFYSADGAPQVSDWEMLPHRNERRSPQPALDPDQRFVLEIVSRPGAPIPTRLRRVALIWLMLGGLGKRSRRMFGAFLITDKPSVPPDQLATEIGGRLRALINDPAPMPNVPEFPTLHPDHSRVVVGTRGEKEWQPLMVSFFRDLLRTGRYRQSENSFGQAMGGRRASPVIAQVRKIGDRYFPVITAMRSRPDRNIDWNIVSQFMQDVEKRWDGITAWGTL